MYVVRLSLLFLHEEEPTHVLLCCTLCSLLSLRIQFERDSRVRVPVIRMLLASVFMRISFVNQMFEGMRATRDLCPSGKSRPGAGPCAQMPGEIQILRT